MFDEKEYREMFSQVTASDAAFRRIMQMKHNARPRRGRGFVTKVLVAAAIISALAVTASAAESVTGWFRSYFAGNSENGLTAQQGMYLDQNEQVIDEVQVQDGWKVELRSALNDGSKAYIILGINAPEDVNLEQTMIDDKYVDWFGPGNGSMKGADKQPLLTCSASGYAIKSYSFGFEEDGDGLGNTKNFVIELDPAFQYCPDPFGSEVEWYIHIENIVHQYENDAYRQELLNGKYKGQKNIMFTSEETEKLYIEDILVERTWDFTVNFAEGKEGVELLSEPVEAMAYVCKKTGSGIDDVEIVYEKVTIDSFVLNSLSATIACRENSVNFEDMYVVMQDGSKILLNDTGSSIRAESPIVLEEADYILFADGTILPMPELTE